LLEVVSEAGPEHLGLHIGQAAEMELAKTQLAFDRGVAELDDPAAASILLLRLGCGHLAAEGDHGFGLFCAQQATSTMLIARTALRLQRTALAIPGPGCVANNQVSRFAFVPSGVAQVLASRANLVVLLGVIIDEDLGGESPGAGAVFFIAAFAQAADVICWGDYQADGWVDFVFLSVK
jgi:hypothetical protein